VANALMVQVATISPRLLIATASPDWSAPGADGMNPRLYITPFCHRHGATVAKLSPQKGSVKNGAKIMLGASLLSRRDRLIVARHEVPGIRGK